MEYVEPAEKIVPIVNYVLGIAHGKEWQFQGARVRHVTRRRQALLEEKEGAKGGSLRLTAKHKISRQRRGDEELKECAAGDAEEFAEETEEQVSTFVDGNEDEVDHQQKSLAAHRLIEKQRVKQQPNNNERTRNRLPGIFENFKDWKALGEGFRDAHGASSF